MDLEKDDTQISAFIDRSEIGRERLKPGPKKIIDLRSEKITCRLTREERQRGLTYCRRYGITEAKLLRTSYLIAITHAPDRLNGLSEELLSSLNETELLPQQKSMIKANMVRILKRFSLLLMLIILVTSLATSPTVAKYFIHMYTIGKGYIYKPGTSFIYHQGDDGFEIKQDSE